MQLRVSRGEAGGGERGQISNTHFSETVSRNRMNGMNCFRHPKDDTYGTQAAQSFNPIEW